MLMGFWFAGNVRSRRSHPRSLTNKQVYHRDSSGASTLPLNTLQHANLESSSLINSPSLLPRPHLPIPHSHSHTISTILFPSCNFSRIRFHIHLRLPPNLVFFPPSSSPTIVHSRRPPISHLTRLSRTTPSQVFPTLGTKECPTFQTTLSDRPPIVRPPNPNGREESGEREGKDGEGRKEDASP